MTSPIDVTQRRTAEAAPDKSGRAAGLRALITRFRSRYAAAVGLIFACLLLLLAWNVVHYPAGQSPDSTDHFAYTDSLRNDHRLPKPKPRPPGLDPSVRVENTGQWYNPPLFYLAAAGIETVTDELTDAVGTPVSADRRHKAVQLFNIGLALGVALFAFLTARELFPRSRLAPVAALAFVALSPTFVRTGVAYHGQMLATFASTAALYVVVRALVRHRLTVRAGVLAGVLLAAGLLTRHFVLATAVAVILTLGVYYVFTRDRSALRMGGALVLAIAVLTAPWYIHQQVEYGNALVASADAPDEPFLSRQPPEFYLGEPLDAVFTQPYRPTYDNRMPQVVYTDWWGDYFLYFDVPREVRATQTAKKGNPNADYRLPDAYHDERVRQSYVGVVPTVLILAGLVGLIIQGIRRRAPHLLLIPLMVGVIALQAAVAYIGYPTSDGDTMRQSYLLTAVPLVAFAAAWALTRLRQKNIIAFGLVATALAVAAIVDVQFLWLGEFVGRAG